MAFVADSPDLDEPFSLYPLDPEEGLRQLLGADDSTVDDASDDDMEDEDS